MWRMLNSGTVALVTGAARGIGAAVTRAFVDAGATVAALDVDAVAATERVLPLATDVSDSGAVERAVAEAEQQLGPISVGVSVAGVLRPGTVCDTSDEDWAATFAVNTSGVFHVLRELGRRMARRGAGSLVVVGSNAAGVPRANMAAYAASKAATTMLARCLGLELAGSGVRCNVVSPGSTDTEMQHRLWTDDNGPERVIAGDLASFRVGIPLGRIADPADVADAVLFLASDRARHITMQNLYVDGGATLRA
ncbi:2,3-dihydro-2,3-dihydroxybenzoate dehydrogenase [Pilimelia terevasa]|uniref:2,3-dihydro-2,3-dihydroxybenzoate dehydrogenase n=2 Tax=Pilimelia terevasa TaxID=53372 RepID=A0A8J3BUC5_9ACTN|nr:2,3-dihydro-2,3-dihydroxybenzoate dehydrogenase [Pilimelia terevasa]